MVESYHATLYRTFTEQELGLILSKLLHQDIKDLADVEHNGAIWDTKPYPKSIKTIIESNWCRNHTKALNIRWDTPSVGSDVLLPEINHVSIYINPISYVCNNVLQ